MTLVFFLGPNSLAVIDSSKELAFVAEGKVHADQGWLPDELTLPWEQRSNISALLRNNCVPANG